MNPAAVRLFLTLLWLVAGVALLVHDLWTGRVIGMPFGQWQMPFWIPCLLIAAFDFVRWWTVRCRATPPRVLRCRRPREGNSESEPNPAFRFDEPSDPPRGEM
jgi:hypothetical protein